MAVVIQLANFVPEIRCDMVKEVRQIFYYRRYYLDFFDTLKPEVQKKFNWTLQLVSTLDRVPRKYFDHITNSTGLYEVKVEVGSDIYRVFSFFDENKLVILVNGFQKKTQKTPDNEIIKAEKLKKQYFDEKNEQ
ncbi:MAG: type II toxin-antitoxin system RelE/ParE family toxin [Tannerella sp.]|nr:type II toxin-antitoxin system RelE/ParE family toxin [Tannerella sp.]